MFLVMSLGPVPPPPKKDFQSGSTQQLQRTAATSKAHPWLSYVFHSWKSHLGPLLFLVVGRDLLFQASPLGSRCRTQAGGRGRKERRGWRHDQKSNNENWSELVSSSGSFLINPRSCWASGLSGMFRDGVCLNSLHLLMQ